MSAHKYPVEDKKNAEIPETYDQELGSALEFSVQLKVTAYAVMITISFLLLILKQTSLIDLSWWWISLPLWLMPAGFAVVTLAMCLRTAWHKFRKAIHIQ